MYQTSYHQGCSRIQGKIGGASSYTRRTTTISEGKAARMSPDPLVRLQADSDNQRIEFIRRELATCFTFTVLATMNYEAGNRDSAEQSKGVAEGVYAAVLPLVSNQECSKHHSDEAIR